MSTLGGPSVEKCTVIFTFAYMGDGRRDGVLIKTYYTYRKKKRRKPWK